jgi:GTP cyclohydrolase IB
MKDIQSLSDNRRINIKKVGVKDISHPVTVLDRANKVQQTIASVNMYVNLPHHFKGTHMSRFVEILNKFHGEINLKNFHIILAEMKSRLQAEEAHMEIEFPYFLKRGNKRPDALDMGEYQCKMHGSLGSNDDLILEINVPVYPPLSNQPDDGLPRSLGKWGNALVILRFNHFIWIEDLIEMIEEVTTSNFSWAAGSGQSAMDQHFSVENLTRILAERLTSHQDISWFSVKVDNLSGGFSTFASITAPVSA